MIEHRDQLGKLKKINDKSLALRRANQNLTSAGSYKAYVRREMVLGSRSATCLTPAAALIHKISSCAGG